MQCVVQCSHDIICCRTAVAIAGDDFVMIASDTRLSRGFNIFSREQSKVFGLTPKTMMTSSGCWADVLTLNKVLQSRLTVRLFCTILFLHS